MSIWMNAQVFCVYMIEFDESDRGFDSALSSDVLLKIEPTLKQKKTTLS